MSRIWTVQEAPRCCLALFEYLVVGSLNLRHSGCVDGSIFKRRAPIRPTLEYCKAVDLISNISNHLHSCSPCSDNRYSFTLKFDRLLRPVVRMKGFSLKGANAFYVRKRWSREHPNCS